MPRRNSRTDWRRASGSLNSRPLRAALFGAAARSADSFSSVASRFSGRRSQSSRPRRQPPPRPGASPYVIARADPPLDALRRAAAPPRFDALRLLRKLPCVYAGWVHVRAPPRSALVPWRPWALFWAELRGGYLLLSREDADAAARRPPEGHRIDYVFGASSCVVSATELRNGTVKLRVRRASRRRSAPDDDAAFSAPMRTDSAPSVFAPLIRMSSFGRKGARRKQPEERSAIYAPAPETYPPFASPESSGETANGPHDSRVQRMASTGALPFGSFADNQPFAAPHCELVMRIPSAPEASKWVWALQNATAAYQSKSQGDFQIIDALGAGAFGRVYLVRDTGSGEYLALKVVDKNLVFRDRLHFESAVNERITLEMVNGHSFMARLRYSFQTQACLYLVTDFYEGGDLFSFLRNHHAEVTEAQAVRIIAEVLLALESMHEKGIVYRDLKPENVLLDKEGHVRLVDLGLAKVLSREHNYLTTTICGSLSYAAPEMLSEREYGLAFDMWTLGVFVYQVLTGDMPFDTEDRSRQDILRDQQLGQIPVNGLSPETHSLVCDLLQPDPARRPSCREVRSHRMFAGIDWDALIAKEPHADSLEETMRKTAARAAARQLETGHDSSPGNRRGAYLLRNFDPDEWSDMTFSDISDGQSTSSFFVPDFTERDRAPVETRMLAGWSFNVDNLVPLNKPQLTVTAKNSMDMFYQKKRSSRKLRTGRSGRDLGLALKDGPAPQPPVGAPHGGSTRFSV